MSDICRVNMDTKLHYQEQEQNEIHAAIEAEANQEAKEELFNQRLARIYSSPDFIWEALSLNAVQYPDSIKNIIDPRERQIAEANFDNDLAMQLSYGLREKDYYLIGMIMGEFAEEYLKQLAED